MSDVIEIQQGGSQVATDELLTAAGGLRVGSDRLDWARSLLASARQLAQDGTCTLDELPELARSVKKIHLMESMVGGLSHDAAELGTSLRGSSDAYENIEDLVEKGLHFVVESAMATLGFVVGRLIPWWVWLIPAPEEDDSPQKNSGLDGKDNPNIVEWAFRKWLATEGSTTFVGEVFAGGDNFVFGLMGVPLLAPILDEDGLGLISGSTVTAAAAITVGTKFGAFREGPVTVEKVATTEKSETSRSTVDLISSLPDDSDGESVNVAITKFVAPDGSVKFEVAIPGTKTFDFVSRAEVADFTSNVWSVGGGESGAYRAVLQAMDEAGIQPGSELTLVGHSQGGLIAAAIASSGQFNVKNLVTVGAPLGSIDLPESVNSILISHSEDIVATVTDQGQNRSALKVNRTLFDVPFSAPADEQVPAHHIEPYLETARLLDEATSPQARSALERLGEFGEGATKVTTTTYVATRTDAG